MKPVLRTITPLISEFFWNQEVSDQLLEQQLSFETFLCKELKDQIEELRIGFKTLAINWKHPVDSKDVLQKTDSFQQTAFPLPETIWQVPVCYSPLHGRDLQTLAKSKNISPDQLIAYHSDPLYRIHFFGFLPGFMYLNGLPKILTAPRKQVPDRTVPAGSVAIGASQTGIYPKESPGGWHLIGRSPLIFFDAKTSPPVWAKAGERLKFIPISEKELDRLLRHPKPAQKL